MVTSGVNRLQKTDQDTKVGKQLLRDEGIHRIFFASPALKNVGLRNQLNFAFNALATFFGTKWLTSPPQ